MATSRAEDWSWAEQLINSIPEYESGTEREIYIPVVGPSATDDTKYFEQIVNTASGIWSSLEDRFTFKHSPHTNCVYGYFIPETPIYKKYDLTSGGHGESIDTRAYIVGLHHPVGGSSTIKTKYLFRKPGEGDAASASRNSNSTAVLKTTLTTEGREAYYNAFRVKFIYQDGRSDIITPTTLATPNTIIAGEAERLNLYMCPMFYSGHNRETPVGSVVGEYQETETEYDFSFYRDGTPSATLESFIGEDKAGKVIFDRNRYYSFSFAEYLSSGGTLSRGLKTFLPSGTGDSRTKLVDSLETNSDRQTPIPGGIGNKVHSIIFDSKPITSGTNVQGLYPELVDVADCSLRLFIAGKRSGTSTVSAIEVSNLQYLSPTSGSELMLPASLNAYKYTSAAASSLLDREKVGMLYVLGDDYGKQTKDPSTNKTYVSSDAWKHVTVEFPIITDFWLGDQRRRSEDEVEWDYGGERHRGRPSEVPAGVDYWPLKKSHRRIHIRIKKSDVTTYGMSDIVNFLKGICQTPAAASTASTAQIGNNIKLITTMPMLAFPDHFCDLPDGFPGRWDPLRFKSVNGFVCKIPKGKKVVRAEAYGRCGLRCELSAFGYELVSGAKTNFGPSLWTSAHLDNPSVNPPLILDFGSTTNDYPYQTVLDSEADIDKSPLGFVPSANVASNFSWAPIFQASAFVTIPTFETEATTDSYGVTVNSESPKEYDSYPFNLTDFGPEKTKLEKNNRIIPEEYREGQVSFVKENLEREALRQITKARYELPLSYAKNYKAVKITAGSDFIAPEADAKEHFPRSVNPDTHPDKQYAASAIPYGETMYNGFSSIPATLFVHSRYYSDLRMEDDQRDPIAVYERGNFAISNLGPSKVKFAGYEKSASADIESDEISFGSATSAVKFYPSTNTIKWTIGATTTEMDADTVRFWLIDDEGAFTQFVMEDVSSMTDITDFGYWVIKNARKDISTSWYSEGNQDKFDFVPMWVYEDFSDTSRDIAKTEESPNSGYEEFGPMSLCVSGNGPFTLYRVATETEAGAVYELVGPAVASDGAYTITAPRNSKDETSKLSIVSAPNQKVKVRIAKPFSEIWDGFPAEPTEEYPHASAVSPESLLFPYYDPAAIDITASQENDGEYITVSAYATNYLDAAKTQPEQKHRYHTYKWTSGSSTAGIIASSLEVFYDTTYGDEIHEKEEGEFGDVNGGQMIIVRFKPEFTTESEKRWTLGLVCEVLNNGTEITGRPKASKAINGPKRYGNYEWVPQSSYGTSLTEAFCFYSTGDTPEPLVPSAQGNKTNDNERVYVGCIGTSKTITDTFTDRVVSNVSTIDVEYRDYVTGRLMASGQITGNGGSCPINLTSESFTPGKKTRILVTHRVHSGSSQTEWGNTNTYLAKDVLELQFVPELDIYSGLTFKLCPEYAWNYNDNTWWKNGYTSVGSMISFGTVYDGFGNYGLQDGSHTDRFFARLTVPPTNGYDSKIALSAIVQEVRDGGYHFVETIADYNAPFNLLDSNSTNIQLSWTPRKDLVSDEDGNRTKHYRVVMAWDFIRKDGNYALIGGGESNPVQIPKKYVRKNGSAWAVSARGFGHTGGYYAQNEPADIYAWAIGSARRDVGPSLVHTSVLSNKPGAIVARALTVDYPIKGLVGKATPETTQDVQNNVIVYGHGATVTKPFYIESEGQIHAWASAYTSTDQSVKTWEYSDSFPNDSVFMSLQPGVNETAQFVIPRGRASKLRVEASKSFNISIEAVGKDWRDQNFSLRDWNTFEKDSDRYSSTKTLSALEPPSFKCATTVASANPDLCVTWFNETPSNTYDKFAILNTATNETSELGGNEKTYCMNGLVTEGRYTIEVSGYKHVKETIDGKTREKTVYETTIPSASVAVGNYAEYSDSVERTPLSDNITLKYSLDDIKIGPNELLTYDTFNQKFSMLMEDLDQIISHSKSYDIPPTKYDGYIGYGEDVIVDPDGERRKTIYGFWNSGPESSYYPLSDTTRCAIINSKDTILRGADSFFVDDENYIIYATSGSKIRFAGFINELATYKVGNNPKVRDYKEVNDTSPDIRSMKVLENGKIIAVAPGFNRVVCYSKLDPTGSSGDKDVLFLYDFGDFGGRGAKLKFNHPIALDVDEPREEANEQWLYVLDEGNQCVKAYSDTGVWKFTSPYSLEEDETATSIAVGIDHLIHVLTNKRVLILDQNGVVGQYKPTKTGALQLCRSRTGKFIYILYPTDIEKVTTSGKYLGNFRFSDQWKKFGTDVNSELYKNARPWGAKMMTATRHNQIYIVLDNCILVYSDYLIEKSLASLNFEQFMWRPEDIMVHKQEYMQDWVINTSLQRLHDNINLFKRSIYSRIRVQDRDGGKLIVFDDLAPREYAKLQIADKKQIFLPSNAPVSAKVINDQLELLYNSLLVLLSFVQDELG